jgi:large subunit ribosomal protein L6
LSVIPPKTVGGKGARTQSMSTVHVKGPLGEMSMEIPPYIHIDQQSYALSLTEDATDKKQKAMWGAQTSMQTD